MAETAREFSPQQVSALSEHLRIACMLISRRVRLESSGEIAPHYISVLVRLEEGALSPRQLSELEQVSAPSMTRTVTRLATLGLVQRHDDPEDGRRISIELTDAGHDALATARVQRGWWMSERVSELNPTEQTVLAEAAEILHRLAAR